MNSKHPNLLGTAALAIVLASTNAAGQTEDTVVSFSTGVEYSSGNYGGTDALEELYVPLTARFLSQRFGLRLTIPYVRIEIPVATDPAQPAQGSASTITQSGLGDIIASMTLYNLYISRDADFVIDLTGKIKLGTADVQKALGTGENDYTTQVETYRFFDRFTLQGLAGYRVRGDTSEVDLNNVFLASVGGAFRASRSAQLGIYYDYRQASLSGLDDIQELSGYASFRLNQSWRIQFYAFTGFGDNSPDVGGGILLTTDLRRPRIRERHGY